jgi:hypothetical protein
MYGIVFINCFLFDFLANFSVGYVCQNPVDFAKINLLILHNLDTDIINYCRVNNSTNLKYIDSILLDNEYDKIKNFTGDFSFINKK